MFGFSKGKTTKADYLYNTETDFSGEKKALLLSSLWVEATNSGFSSHALKHDLIELSHDPLPKDIEKEIKSQVNGDSIIADMADTYSRCSADMGEDLIFKFYTFTPDLWQQELDDLTQKRHLDKAAHLRAFKKRFEHVHTRTWLVTYQMWCVRMSVYLGEITKEKGWELLNQHAQLLETVLPSFKDWQGFFHNIQMGENLFNCEYTGFEKSMEHAAKHLIKDESSPVQGVDLFDKALVPDSFVPYTNKVPQHIHYRDTEPYAPFMAMLKNPDKSPLWDFFRDLAASKDKASEQKADMCVKIIEPEIIDYETAISWPKAYPDEPMAWVLRGRWYLFWSYEARGGGTGDMITPEGANLFHHRVGLAIQDLKKAYELDPNNPLIISELLFTIPFLEGRSDALYKTLKDRVKQEFPTHTPSFVSMGFHETRKWGGYRGEYFETARWMIKQTKEKDQEASLAPMLLFEAAIEEWLYEDQFDQTIEDEMAPILKNDKLQDEVNSFFPEMLGKMDANPVWMGSWMALWYYLVKDVDRLRLVVRRMNELCPGCYYKRPFGYRWEAKAVERNFYWMRWL